MTRTQRTTRSVQNSRGHENLSYAWLAAIYVAHRFRALRWVGAVAFRLQAETNTFIYYC